MSEKFKQLEIEAEAKARRLASEFQRKVDSLKERIGALEQEKTKIRDGKVSLSEGVTRMKQDLKKGFDEWVKSKFIEPSLRTYASGHFRPFISFDHMKTHLLHNTEWLFFIFAWISPTMVDEVAGGLEWDGPDEKTRTEKIKQLDGEISKTEKELENLLK